jgi:hypothetical protein
MRRRVAHEGEGSKGLVDLGWMPERSRDQQAADRSKIVGTESISSAAIISLASLWPVAAPPNALPPLLVHMSFAAQITPLADVV